MPFRANACRQVHTGRIWLLDLLSPRNNPWHEMLTNEEGLKQHCQSWN